MQLQKTIYWLFVIFLIYIIFELIRKLLGGSLSSEELIIALLIVNLGYSFNINSKLNKHLGFHQGYKFAKQN